MRRTCYLIACVVCLIAASVLLLHPAQAGTHDSKATSGRGIAVLSSSIGSDYSPEALAKIVERWRFSPVVIDWAWITAHWGQTNFTALNRFIDLMAAKNIPVAVMYRPRFLNNPTVPIQVNRTGKPAASHGAYICFSSPQARQWGIYWGTQILQKCPRVSEIIIYNPLNSCQCPTCQSATQGNSYAHYDMVWSFLAEAKATWRQQNPAVKLGVVFVTDPQFWQRGARIVDVAHPYLFIKDDTDMAKDAAAARAIRDLLPDKTGSFLAKLTWGETDKVTPVQLEEFDKSAAQAGLSYFFWTFETLVDPKLYDQKAVAQILRKNPMATSAQPAAGPLVDKAPARHLDGGTAAPKPVVADVVGSGQPGNLIYAPEEIRRISAESFLDRMLNTDPGFNTFAAMNALAQKAKESDATARRQILSLVIAAMKDKSRPVNQRWQCCYVLSGSQDAQGVPDLVQVLLHDELELMRSVAAEALADFYKYANNTAAHDALLQAARQETSPRVREVLSRRLGQEMPAPIAAPTPAPVEDNPILPKPPRQSGLKPGQQEYTPEEIRSTPTEVFLKRILYPEPNCDSFYAMNALIEKAKQSDARARDNEMKLVIAAMLDKRNPASQRWQCCYIISDSGYDAGIPALIQVLSDGETATLRGVAACALGKFPQSVAAHSALLQASRKETDSEVLEQLEKILGPEMPTGKTPTPTAPQSTVQAHVSETDPPAGAGSGDRMYSPEQIRNTSAEVFLERMAKAEPGYQTFAAMNALTDKIKASDPAARKCILELVIGAMQNTKRSVYQRYQCCYVLSGSGDARGVPYLIQILQTDKSANLRAVAVEALSEFSDNKAAHEALIQAGRTENNYIVREILTRKLGAEMPDFQGNTSTPPDKAAPTVPTGAAVPELAPSGPPQPPAAPKTPVSKPLPWPFEGGQQAQNVFNNYQQPTDVYIHCGLDMLHPIGTPVTAVESGYVAAIFPPNNITHCTFVITPKQGGNVGWAYTHLDPHTFTFKVGDFVRQGQHLGDLVDFAVDGNRGAPHLHLHYVSFTPQSYGNPKVHSLLDPLYFFDWQDTIAPAFQPLRFVAEGTLREFPADANGMATVRGKVDILATVTDSAYSGHLGNLGVPVVMYSISDGKRTLQKQVVDHRGDVGDETQVEPIYLTFAEKKQFINTAAFPRYQMLWVTKTDGDGKITPRDAAECWDTTAWPDGQYSVNVYAWDIAGNRGAVGAIVRVDNR